MRPSPEGEVRGPPLVAGPRPSPGRNGVFPRWGSGEPVASLLGRRRRRQRYSRGRPLRYDGFLRLLRSQAAMAGMRSVALRGQSWSASRRLACFQTLAWAFWYCKKPENSSSRIPLASASWFKDRSGVSFISMMAAPLSSEAMSQPMSGICRISLAPSIAVLTMASHRGTVAPMRLAPVREPGQRQLVASASRQDRLETAPWQRRVRGTAGR
jgi:hypothetical protein